MGKPFDARGTALADRQLSFWFDIMPFMSNVSFHHCYDRYTAGSKTIRPPIYFPCVITHSYMLNNRYFEILDKPENTDVCKKWLCMNLYCLKHNQVSPC